MNKIDNKQWLVLSSNYGCTRHFTSQIFSGRAIIRPFMFLVLTKRAYLIINSCMSRKITLSLYIYISLSTRKICQMQHFVGGNKLKSILYFYFKKLLFWSSKCFIGFGKFIACKHDLTLWSQPSQVFIHTIAP